MNYRCFIDKSGYCTDPDRRNPGPAGPVFFKSRDITELAELTPTKCPNHPQNCGFFISWQEECRRAMGPATPLSKSKSFKEVS
ncbi:hypothetical protein ES705_24288 [subsurface metagenome]